MSKEEEIPTRVTRGALRRMSVEQDPTASAPGTPKKTTTMAAGAAATSKKLAVLDAIQEGSNGPSDAEVDTEDSTGTGRGSSSRTNRSAVHKSKQELDRKVAPLTEENVNMFESMVELRRTPRRRPSQDLTLTPQTLPKRVTRRNSVTSDDGNLGVVTPKASRTRHSLAAVAIHQSVIVEDDEKEEQANASGTAEADVSDLDILKLRNRSFSKSPVPCKNTSTTSIKEGVAESSSPQKTEKASVSEEKDEKPESTESIVDDAVSTTPVRSESVISVDSSVVSEQQPVPAATATKDVKFEEGTPDQLNKSKYPKTPVAVVSGGKRRKLSELAAEAEAADREEEESMAAESEIIIVDETIKDSPQVFDQKPETPKTPTKASASPKKEPSKIIIVDETIKESPRKTDLETESPKTPTKANGTPKKATTPKKTSDAEEESPNKSLDTSIANLVEQVREEMNQSAADLSMSILGTPKPVLGYGKHKTHMSRLHEGSSSTPIAAKHAALDEIPEEEKEETSAGSKSWSQAVKGSGKDKGIDVFSVRKQEEEEKQEEETKSLNESLKRKSLEKMKPLSVVEDEEDDEEGEEDEEEVDASQKQSSFVDDEAMEVDGYQSGDSMDSETRAEMEENQVEEDGESIGSQDTDEEDEEDGDDDSFIASDGEEVEDLLEGTEDELHSDEEADKSDKMNKKKRKRIIQQEDSSEDEKETSKAEKTLNESAASGTKSPKKSDSSKSSNVSKTDSPKKTPQKTVEAKSPKKTPSMKSLDEEEVQEESAKDVEESTEETKPTTPKKSEVPESPKSAKKSPTKVQAPTEVPESPKSPKKTPSKPTQETAETKQTKSVEKRRSESEDASDVAKSRKSLPTPALLISADFYSSSAKKAKRNTMDAAVPTNEEEPEQSTNKEEPSSNLVTNPAALALAKKNKRLSQGLSPAAKQDKRVSLPGKLPDEKELDTPLKKKNRKLSQQEEDSAEKQNANDSVEPMEVDEDEEEEEEEEEVVPDSQPPPPKKPAKKKPKDLSEFDTDAILSRCNEIVRADKEKRKEGATLRQKKKDEKRRQREQEQQEDAAGGEANDESMEQQKKKKKKKKKQVNYLLEELGETKEDQVARALQRKMALLEAKRERKKAKKAAKLRQQLNKENQQEDKEKVAEGIGAKLEKVKKAKKVEKEVKKAILQELKPVVKRAVSAFAMYSEQIEELKKEQLVKKKSKSKQLKEKSQEPTAVEEVQAALQTKPEYKPKKDKAHKQKHVSTEEVSPPVEQPKVDKNKEVEETVVEEPVAVKHKKKDKTTAVKPEEVAPKKKKVEQVNTAPLKSVVSLDDELAQLKKSLLEPVVKVVKKQKLSHKEPIIATVIAREVTPPRKTTTGKLKALTRLETGFHEEPVTPDHKLLKRNHGFKEEPVTPKTVGFKVSSVLPVGQEALKQEAVEAKRKKTYHNKNRIRPEDVREPARGLPLPVWTRSGTFEVEELDDAAKPRKASKSESSDYVPLNVNGGNNSTEFLVKPLGGSKSKHRSGAGGGVSKVHRIDVGTVDQTVLNFKKQAIFGKNAHLREKKAKH